MEQRGGVSSMTSSPPNCKDVPRYSDDAIQRCLNLYLKDATFARIADITGVTRATLHTWAKRGELTEGVTWQEYREAMHEAMVQEVRMEELERTVDKERAYLEQVKQDLREIVYEELIRKYRDGDFKASIGDMTEVVKLYSMLENGAAEKMAFAEFFATKVLAIVFDVVSDKDFAAIKARIALMQAEVEAKLNPLSITHSLVAA